jgi:hypothetical protein
MHWSYSRRFYITIFISYSNMFRSLFGSSSRIYSKVKIKNQNNKTENIVILIP